MNFIKYKFLKVRLFFASKRTRLAKSCMLSAIGSTKSAARDLNEKYDRFMAFAKKQQEIAVALKRVRQKRTPFPILNKRISVGAVNITSKASDRFSSYDIKMALTRHKNCDWGCVPIDIWSQNNKNAQYNSGVVSSCYKNSEKYDISVETDLSSNTTLLSLKEAA